jgi:Patatin-like phospholipase
MEEWPLHLWQVLWDELVAFQKKLPEAPLTDPFLYSHEDIDSLSLLLTQIAARKPELTKIIADAPFAAKIDQLDPEKGTPNAGTEQTALDVLNQLLKTKNLGDAFLNVPIGRSVLEQEQKSEQEKKSLNSEQRIVMNRDLLDYAFAGGVRPVSDKLMPGIVDKLHEAKLSALCFSGGGIRSATFCLGALQGLAKKGFLDRFDYLSTVSGGGYLGGWLAAWTYWSKGDLPRVIKQLSNPTASKLEPEPDPIFYLRNFSNYLTPRTGLFSVDTWTLGATYLRNLLLNWIVLLPLLITILAAPRLVLVLLHPLPACVTCHWRELAKLACWLLVVIGFACSMFYQGMARPSNLKFLDDRSLKSRWALWWMRHRRQPDFLKYCLAPLMISAFLLATYIFHAYLFSVSDYSKLPKILLIGGVSALVGWLAIAILLGESFIRDLVAMLLSALLGVALFYSIVIIPSRIHCYWQNPELYLSLAPPLVMVVFLIAATIFVGLATFWTDDEDREYWSRMGAWILIASFGWAALGLISLKGPELFALDGPWKKLGTYVSGLVVSAVTAYLGFSGKTPANVDSEKATPSPASLQRALPIFGGISIVLILAMLAVAACWLVNWTTANLALPFAAPHTVTLWGAFLAILLAGALGGFMSIFVDPNKYSLHAMYRNRLIRAYLGASREKGARRPNPLTGFDPKDNIPMAKLWKCGPRKLMPFINMTLNMVEPVSTKLAWQERKAESFTVTPLHSGSLWVGYRRSKDYAIWNYLPFTKLHHAQKDTAMPITLGTATAISGAAVSPDMGYNSSPIVSILLTLFNARLGWWLGNPGTAGSDTYMYSNPGNGAKYLIDEALGRTNDVKPHVNLSDGGHFENLGLYEMVLRRCHTIVVIDADQDQGFAFEDLGNAIRKIRTDMGISIDFESFSNFQKHSPPGDPTLYCSVGNIHYGDIDKSADDGLLIYIKPTITGKESADVLNYERQHPEFPHESTADQWFTESQFESYRALGEYEIMQIFENPWASEPQAYVDARDILSKVM